MSVVEVVLNDGSVYEASMFSSVDALREAMTTFTDTAWISGYGPLYREGRGEAWLRASTVAVIRERPSSFGGPR